MADSSPDLLFLQEQRRFRRLEVSLPVWITTREAFDDATDIWELGTTRDLSLGGAKVFVPNGEEEQWRDAVRQKVEFVVKIDSNGQSGEAIPCFIKNAAPDRESGRFALAIQFQTHLADEAREKALRAGMATMKTRHHWQFAFAASLLAFVFAVLLVSSLVRQVADKNAQITQFQTEINQLPRLAATKSQGIESAFRREELQGALGKLNALNDPRNRETATADREKNARDLGIAPHVNSQAARVQLGVLFPYGYNWPQVMNEFETVLGRKIPQVVLFSDFAQGFPDLDAREARARGKTLQITWEPWKFSDPNAVKLSDVAAGRYDAYIDDFAAASRSFGGELWFRFAHEPNGNWYPWSFANTGQSPKIWLAAYKRVHDRFQRAGASNVRWIWCVNAESVPDLPWNDAFKAYPGDNYVDAIGLDGYNFGDTLAHSRWQSFEEIFAASYASAQQVAPNRPIFIAETGCSSTGGDKAQWLHDMDAALRGPMNRVERLTWFEATKEADWRVLSSPATVDAARQVWSSPYYRRGEN